MTYRKSARNIIFLLVMALPLTVTAASPAKPYVNPHMADSNYSETHQTAHFTPQAGPEGISRRLNEDEYQWKPLGPSNAFVPFYSGAYPNGKRVIWVGGYDRVAKLDADTLEVLTTYAIGGNTFYTEEQTRRYIDDVDKLSWREMIDYRFKDKAETFPSILSFYRMLSSKNELYLPYRAPDGSLSLQVYGEANAADPASKISLRREFNLSGKITKASIWGMTMTSDGTIVIGTSDGKLIALSQDFKHYDVMDLPRRIKDSGDDSHYFASFARNGPATDDKGGVYIVTRDYLHRVKWTGKKLSLKEREGAWSVPYPNDLGIGSGTTPALMGWGLKEDHLVVITDATDGNNMMAFWRDEIPEDWQGLPGFDRRVAGVTPVRFGVTKDEKPQIENSIVVYGYGAFLDNFDSQPEGLTELGDSMTQAMAGALLTNVPGHEAKGATMIRWNPETRQLETVWTNQTNFVMSICTVSGANETIYCWGSREGGWGLEAIDWNTGENKFHYTLGKSQRFNVMGGVINIAPNGAIDCGCLGGLGIVRIMPNEGE